MNTKLRILTGSIALLLATDIARAVTDTWDGGDGASNNIGVGANWADNTAPVSDLVNTDLIFAGLVRLTPNFGAVFSANSLTFDNTAGAFSFTGLGLTIGAGGIVNNDAQAQTFQNAITVGTATSIFNAASGGLTFTNSVGIGGNTLTLAGAGAFSFGSISGTGTVNKTGAGTMTWAAPALNQFDFTIGAGIVNTTADGTTDVFDITASLAVNGTSTLNLNENATLDGALLTRASGAALTIATGKTLTLQNGADATFTGGFSYTATAGTFLVTGSGSTFVASGGPLSIAGGAALNVTAGGAASSTSSINIGTVASGGTISADGTGSTLTGSTLTIGNNGGTASLTLSNGAVGTFSGGIVVTSGAIAGTNGTLTIQSGATATGASLSIAGSAGTTTGTVTIFDSSSALTISGAGATTIGAASVSTANFNVQSGGTFNSGTGTTTVNATGVVNITGGTFNANGNMTVNGTVNRDVSGAFNLAAGTTLTVQNGGDVNFTGAAYEHATTSTVTVTGAGSTLSTNGSNQLRFRGGSTFNVLAGADVTVGGGIMLAITAAGGSATMLVDGAGSTLTALGGSWGLGAAANVTFSNSAVGTLIGSLTLAGTSTAGTAATVNINSGATLSASSLALAFNGGTVSGIVTIDGSGSAFTLGTGGGIIGSLFSTTATVNVNNSGVFNTGTGALTVNNTGVIAIAGGTVNFQGDTTFDASDLTFTGSGVFTVAAGKTLLFQNGADIAGTIPFSHNSAGTVTLTGAGTTLIPAGANGIGVRGGGTLNLLAGATASGGIQVIGDSGNGTFVVDGTGSSIADIGLSLSAWGRSGFTGTVTFRNSATGTLGSLDVANSATAGTAGIGSIESGADLSLGNLTLGHATSNATGTLTVTGSGSTATQTGASTLTIGGTAGASSLSVQSSGVFNAGTGMLTVNATGAINLDGGTVNLNGNVVVTGGQLNQTTGGFYILAAGRSMTVQAGGDLNFATADLTASGTSVITLMGAGTTYTGSFLTSLGATSQIIINSGAVANIVANGGLQANAGTTTVDGAGSQLNSSGSANDYIGFTGNTAVLTFSNNASGAFDGTLSVAFVGGTNATGTLNVNTGADFAPTNLQIAASGTNTTGTVTVTGAGSTITQSGAGTLTVGKASSGTGTLNVNSGAVFTTGTGGTTVNATGTVTIAAGTMNSNGNLTLDGGQLSTTGSSVFNHNAGTFTVQAGGDATFSLAPGFAAATSVVVTGAGSTLSRTGGNLFFSNSSLAVTAGGAVSATGFIDIGNAASTTAVVSGAGSSLTAVSTSFWGNGSGTTSVTFSNNATGNLATVHVGNSGATTNATLHIASGADVTLGQLNIATTTNTTVGTVNVGGVGSTLTVTGLGLGLGLGSGSTATLNITSGGTVTLTSTGANNLVLNPTGTVNLNGGSLILGDPVTRNGGVLNLNAGLLSLNESLAIGAGGLLGENLTLTANRQLIVGPTHTTTVDALQTLTLDGGALTTGALASSGTIAFNSGTLAITGAGGFNIGTGALGANVTLGTGANLSVTNTATVAASGSLTVDGGSATFGALSNSGLVEHARGALTVTGAVTNAAGADFFAAKPVSIGGVFTNQSGARLVLQNGTGRIGGAGSVSNSGLITGDGVIATTSTNNASGEIRAETGKTLRFTGAASANAGQFTLLGGTLDFIAPLTNSATGFITGAGALRTGGLTNNGVAAFAGGNANIFGDVTNAAGARIVTSGAGATTTFFDDLAHNGTEIFTGAGASTVIFGAATGAGAYTGTGTVYSIGDLRPGNSPATVSYGGSLVLGNGMLSMEIGGLSEGSQYDSLHIASSLYADGILSLALINGYMPALGAMFDIFDTASTSGAFDSFMLPALAQYLAWNTSALYSTGTVSVQSTLTPIEQWRLLHFSDPANAGDGADNNDFDGDGAQNLLEYALALDPRVPSADGLPALSVVTAAPNQHIALTIVRPLSATDITYQIEVGTLGTFLPGSSYSSGGDIPTNANTTQVSRINDGTFETLVIRDNTALTAATSRFLRLKVSNP